MKRNRIEFPEWFGPLLAVVGFILAMVAGMGGGR